MPAPTPPRAAEARTFGTRPRPGRRYWLVPVVAVVIVVIVVIAGLTLAGVLFKRPGPSTGATPANVQIDRYPSGSNYTGQYGDEPSIARAPNGTLYVAWIGYDLLGPAPYSGAQPNFTTSIWLASSANDGQTYSQPIRLSPVFELYPFDPSLAILPNGTVLAAWLNESSSGSYSVVLATLPPKAGTFSLSIPISGEGLDRPWITSSANGTVFLTYDQFIEYAGATYWMVSYDGGRSFAPPRLLMHADITEAIVAGPEGTLYAAGLVQSFAYGDAPVRATFLVAGVDTLNGTTSVVPIATAWLPYPTSFIFENESWPGPALTMVGGTLVAVYSANNASELVSRTSTKGGNAWSSPVVLDEATGVLHYMP